MDIKQKILSKSNQYNYYKNNYHRLLNDNKKLKEENEKLSKQNKLINEENEKLTTQNKRLNSSNETLKNEFILIKPLIVNHSPDQYELNYCPVCGRPSTFISAGATKRPKALCPNCRSFERHRLFFLVLLKKYSNIFHNEIKLLHFAPERYLYSNFINKDNIDYYPVDINPKKYEKMNIILKKQVNMEDIPYPDNNFDFIINSHILEHVTDDLKAMSEVYRVLKKNGTCFVSTPLSGNYETLENPEYNTPELRLKYYKQEDHLRYYGYDIKEKLESVGFNVTPYSIKDVIPSDMYKAIYGIREKFILYICEK